MYLLPGKCDLYFVNILNIFRRDKHDFTFKIIMYVPHSIIKLEVSVSYTHLTLPTKRIV